MACSIPIVPTDLLFDRAKLESTAKKVLGQDIECFWDSDSLAELFESEFIWINIIMPSRGLLHDGSLEAGG
jgi:hypothetical protein